MIRFLITIFVLASLTYASSMVHELNDYKTHPCIRNCSASTKSMECEYHFTVEWYKTLSKACYDCPHNMSDCSRPHCITANGVERVVMSVNRMIPGPQILVCQNDMVSVYVHNKLRMGESTSIHWHGILQKGTPHMDGVGMVTQCPITPHGSFQYRFKAEDVGTHFWHAHVGLQRSDGVFGPIVVRPKSDLHVKNYDYDLNEHVIVLNDWFDETIISKFAFNQHDKTDNDMPDAILINGLGVDHRKKEEHERDGKDDDSETPRAVFTVKQGYRYRLRLINAGVAFCPMQFIVDNHTLTVIAIDGKAVEPEDFQTVVLHAGERYDVVINTKQRAANYWIKVKGIGDCEDHEVYQTAILNYNTISADAEPNGGEIESYESILVTGKQLNNVDIPDGDETGNYIQINELKSVLEPKNENFYERIKGKPDKKYYFGMEFKKINNPEFNDPLLYPIKLMPLNKQFYTPQINKISLDMPAVPVLSQYNDIPKGMICNEENIEKVCPKNSTEFCACLHIIEVSLNDLVEFTFVDETLTQFDIQVETIHPIHMHGYTYAVVAMDDPPAGEPTTAEYIKRLDEEGKIERNFDRPPIRDTVIVPDGGYTTLRFIANNPGVWIVHCHLEFHMETGMGFLLKVGDVKQFPQEPENWPKCGSFEFEKEPINNSAQVMNGFKVEFFSLSFLIIFFLKFFSD